VSSARAFYTYEVKFGTMTVIVDTNDHDEADDDDEGEYSINGI
jgi:hypothetical protein